MALDLNPLLENLQERVVQEKPLKLIYAKNTYHVFDRGSVEYNGAYGEWIGDQPLEGVQWDKELTSDDLKKLPDVFSCKLPIIHDKVYYTIINKKVMKRALQSPTEMAILVDRLTDSMKTKPVLDINQALTAIISNPDNYRTVKEISEDDATIDDMDKAINALKLIRKASTAMLEPDTEYNKGYQKPGSTTWNQVLANSESKNKQVLIIDPDFLEDIEIHFLSDVNDDSSINPYKIFKAVIPKKLDNNMLASIQDEKSLSYQIINEDGITTEQVFGSGNTKFGYHVTVVGGMIPFTPAWCLVKK